MDQLILSHFVVERQVNQEKRDFFQFQFDHQFLHAPLEIVILLSADGILGEERIALFVVDGNTLQTRILAVF